MTEASKLKRERDRHLDDEKEFAKERERSIRQTYESLINESVPLLYAKTSTEINKVAMKLPPGEAREFVKAELKRLLIDQLGE